MPCVVGEPGGETTHKPAAGADLKIGFDALRLGRLPGLAVHRAGIFPLPGMRQSNFPTFHDCAVKQKYSQAWLSARAASPY